MENDLPVSGEPASVATSDEVQQDAIVNESESTENVEQSEEGGEGESKESKPEKTPEQREIDRLRKSTARLTRQREEARAALAYARSQETTQQQANDDGETLSLTRAELEEFVRKQAEQIAPTIQQQKAQAEQRKAVVDGLLSDLGESGFNELANNLDDAFNGLQDQSGQMKPALEAVFYSDDPKAVIKYLGDPENMEEAEAISMMNPAQAGRAIAKIELKLEAEKSNAKPKPSNASKPLEAVKGGGTFSGMPDPSDTKAYIKWANSQEVRL